MSFDIAFSHTMKFEVGPHFDQYDPETIAGLCSTPSQKRKTGYVNDPQDSGGETKFGIAKSAHPNLNIRGLGLAGAKMIYVTKYWGPSKCSEYSTNVGILVFDAAVNHGVSRSIVFLQRALGLIEDGIVGPATLAKAKAIDEKLLCEKYLNVRQKFFDDIVKNKPSQAKFINGWTSRVNELRKI